jgi:hypothetical protein
MIPPTATRHHRSLSAPVSFMMGKGSLEDDAALMSIFQDVDDMVLFDTTVSAPPKKPTPTKHTFERPIRHRRRATSIETIKDYDFEDLEEDDENQENIFLRASSDESNLLLEELLRYNEDDDELRSVSFSISDDDDDDDDDDDSQYFPLHSTPSEEPIPLQLQARLSEPFDLSILMELDDDCSLEDDDYGDFCFDTPWTPEPYPQQHEERLLLWRPIICQQQRCHQEKMIISFEDSNGKIPDSLMVPKF